MHPSPVALQNMNLHVDVERVIAAHDTVRSELLGERTVGGHWVGELSSSPLATATAISALVIAHGNGASDAATSVAVSPDRVNLQRLLQGDLSELIVESLHWLAERQNEDGGWSDTERGRSNLAATLLVRVGLSPDLRAGQVRRFDGPRRRIRHGTGRRRRAAEAIRPRQKPHRADPGERGAGRPGALAASARPALRVCLLSPALVLLSAVAGRELRDSGARQRSGN